MGLDSYLERRTRTYIWKDGGYDYVEHGSQIGYWRKFNALHNYIVQNFANGVDECQPIHLHEEYIDDLLTVLKEVKNDHNTAHELLPTTDGFFFGSTEYDEYYFEDVDSAIEIFERARKDTDFQKSEIYYQASW